MNQKKYHQRLSIHGGRETSTSEEDLETLKELGLTELQGKVYLALTTIGECKAGKVSEFSKVTRPDIYRVLRELQSLNLVEKIIGTPEEFVATPLEKGISILYEARLTKLRNLHEKTEKLVSKFAKSKPRVMTTSGNFKFVETSERGAVLAEILERNKGRNWQTLDIVSSWKRAARWSIVNRKEIDETLNRGVKIRLVVDEPNGASKSSLRNLDVLNKKPFFQLRFASSEPPALLSIEDNDEVNMILNPTPYGVGGFGRCLFSNHPGFVGLTRAYFDSLWAKSKDWPSETESFRKARRNTIGKPSVREKVMVAH